MKSKQESQPAGQGNYAANWDELASRLGVTRRAVQEWRKDPRYADYPRDRADGRKDVAAWAAFMVQHSLKRADQNVESSDHDEDDPTEDPSGQDPIIRPPRIAGTQADWQKAILHEKHETARAQRHTIEGTLLVAADLEVPLGATFAAIQTKLSQFPARVARHVKGLREESEIEAILRDEIDADLSELQTARYLDVTVGEILAELPFDDESARLHQLVTFAGQDAAALHALIARVALEALRRIGRNAIAANLDRPISDRDQIADTITGQVTPEAEHASAVERASEKSDLSDKNPRRKKKPRPKPASPPPEVEAAIHSTPRRRK